MNKKAITILLLVTMSACVLVSTVNADTTFDQYLVASYQMNEASGLITADTSGNNLDGQLINTPIFTTGKYNNGLSFATNQYVRVAGESSLAYTTMSVSFWFNNSIVDASAAGIRMINKKSVWNSAYDWNIQMNTAGRINVLGSSSTTAAITIYTGGSWDTNTWHHLVVTFEDTTVKAYLDSAYKGTGTITSIVSSNTQMEIGGSYLLNTYWSGIMDDLRIYNTTLSSSQVLELYNDNPDVPLPTVTPSSIASLEESSFAYNGIIILALFIVLALYLSIKPVGTVNLAFGILTLGVSAGLALGGYLGGLWFFTFAGVALGLICLLRGTDLL